MNAQGCLREASTTHVQLNGGSPRSRDDVWKGTKLSGYSLQRAHDQANTPTANAFEAGDLVHATKTLSVLW